MFVFAVTKIYSFYEEEEEEEEENIMLSFKP
jgi:hypothetical protein